MIQNQVFTVHYFRAVLDAKIMFENVVSKIWIKMDSDPKTNSTIDMILHHPQQNWQIPFIVFLIFKLYNIRTDCVSVQFTACNP